MFVSLIRLAAGRAPGRSAPTGRAPIGLILLLGLALLGLSAPGARAAGTIAVTNLNDSGPGSLRQAIANATSGDTITFSVSGVITLTTGQLVVNKDLTLSGPGAASLAINGNRANISLASRVISNSAHLTISGLTIREGEGGVGGGGGILNQGGGVLSVSSSVFALNRAWQGGAIYNSAGGQVTIADSTFHANSGSAPIDANGGAIYNAAPGGVVAISGSEFDFNTTHDNGSSLYNQAGATIVNSTFVYNQAGTSAVYNFGTLTVNNATLTGNVSNGKPGSGVAADKNASTVVRNSIIAGNRTQGSNKPADAAECDGPISSGGHNIVGYPGSCGWTAAAGDQLGTINAPIDPLLGIWQDNGGPTLTLLPQAGSPAIDAGDPAAPGSGGSACAATDQRGATRPAFGGVSATCDIGAAEAGSSLLLVSSSSPTTLGQPTSFSASGLGGGFSYTWNFGDGTPPASGAAVSHTYASAGVYSVGVSAVSGATSRTASTVVTINNPKPALASVAPATLALSSPDFTLTVTGSGFVAGATVYVRGQPRATALVAPGQLTATVLASDTAAGGPTTLTVTVVNPGPGGGTSNSLTLPINGAQALAGQRTFLAMLRR